MGVFLLVWSAMPLLAIGALSQKRGERGMLWALAIAFLPVIQLLFFGSFGGALLLFLPALIPLCYQVIQMEKGQE